MHAISLPPTPEDIGLFGWPEGRSVQLSGPWGLHGMDSDQKKIAL